MNGLMFSSKPNFIHFIIFVVVLGFSIYFQSLHGELVSDDYRLVTKNPAVVEFKNFSSIWDSFNTRFLVGLTFALNYQNHQDDPFGYHLFSLLVHLINCLLVYYFCLRTLALSGKSSILTQYDYSKISFLAATIFLCHPVQTQAVSSIAQRGTLMVTGFYLLAHIFYIKGRMQGNKLFLGLTFLPLVLGFLSKEIILPAGMALLIYEVYFLRNNAPSGQRPFKWLTGYLLLTLMFPLIFFQSKPTAAINFKHLMGFQLFEWKVFLTEINVLITYLRLFLWPVGLRSDYYYPVTQSILEPHTIGSILLVIVLMFAMVRLFKNYRLISFCILWFFLTKSVEFAGVTFGLRNLIYENWLYLSMVGLCLLSAVGIAAVFKNQGLYKLAVLMLVTLLSVAAHARNEVWITELGHYQDLVQKEPGYPSAYLGLSDAYWRKGQIDPAIFYLKKAIALKPDFPNGHNNLGILYSQKGMNQKALYHFKKTLESDPDFYGVYQNLGYLAFINCDYVQAIQYYKKYLEYHPDVADCYYYIGMSYYRTKDKVAAQNNLLKAREIYQKYNQTPQIELVDETLRVL